MEQPLDVVNATAYLPSNLYRLLNTYDENDIEIRYSTNGAYLFNMVDYNGNVVEDADEIFIDYIGLVLDDDCKPMIHEKHIQACETFCKMQMFEEEYAMGKFNINLWREWQQGLPGMIQAAKGSNYRQFSRDHLTNINIIRGNMFPRLEKTTLRDENIYPKKQD